MYNYRPNSLLPQVSKILEILFARRLNSFPTKLVILNMVSKRKMEFYDIRGVAGDFLKYYLSNRSQFVSLSNSISTNQKILCGVPQGSVLGSILFNIYLNDIVYASEIFKFVLFADDTDILFSSKNYECVKNTVNT